MNRLKQMAGALRTGCANQFQTVGDVGLFLGLACNLAFVGQVYFWPVMWHTSALLLSHTDVTYVAEMLCASALFVHLRRGSAGPSPRLLWVMAALVQGTLVLYCVMFKLNIPVPDAMNWLAAPPSACTCPWSCSPGCACTPGCARRPWCGTSCWRRPSARSSSGCSRAWRA